MMKTGEAPLASATVPPPQGCALHGFWCHVRASRSAADDVVKPHIVRTSITHKISFETSGRAQMPVSELQVPAHAGLVDPEDRLQRALRGVVFFAYERHEQGVPEAQLASVPGIRRRIPSRNSGMSPEAVAHAPVRSKIYRNSSLLHRVAECRLDSSDMTPSNTSILCRSVWCLGPNLSPCCSTAGAHGLAPRLSASKFFLVFYFLVATCI